MRKGTLLHYHDIEQLDFDKMPTKTTQKARQHIRYYNVPASYDIETTSFRDEKGDPVAITYSHALNIDGYVFKMEEWEDFENAMGIIATKANLDKKNRLIIYVHNLSYEFQFMKHHFTFTDVFSNGSERKILYALTDMGIEFRCSYMLSGMSLGVLATKIENYEIEKTTEDFDYSKIRTPLTPLTEKEKGYVLNDVLIIEYYIRERMEEAGGDITKIPLTKTGYVREDMRQRTIKDDTKVGERYRTIMEQLTLEPDEYMALRNAFAGGFTHGNIKRLKQTHTDVHAKDFASSYPARMVAYQFPMSKGERYSVKDKEDFKKQINSYCCLFFVEFTNIIRTSVEPYLSTSKATRLVGGVNNNGRMDSAETASFWLTDIDFISVLKSYEFDDYKIGTLFRYRRGYLPTPFVEGILDMYESKTKLKGVEGAEGDYNRSKENLNSSYGMTVMDIIQDTFEWDDELKESHEGEIDLDDRIKKNNRSRNRFLFYPWGVWITAYARMDLFDAIVKLGDDYIYSDTDSVYYNNPDKHRPMFDTYNERITKLLNRACDFHGIDRSKVAPKDPKGRTRTLGIWEDDGHYTRFKTLGAKRYMVESEKEDGTKSINITVSGVNKSVAVPYLIEKYGENIFDAFDENLEIPAGYAGKSVHTYVDEIRIGTIVDYNGVPYRYVEDSGVHLEETSYNLTISNELSEMIEMVRGKYK